MESKSQPPRAVPFQKYVVPAILGPAAERLVEAAGLKPSERVLDLACGSGAATRPAARAVGAGGRVLGVDFEEAMLAVARAVPHDEGATIEWRHATPTFCSAKKSHRAFLPLAHELDRSKSTIVQSSDDLRIDLQQLPSGSTSNSCPPWTPRRQARP